MAGTSVEIYDEYNKTETKKKNLHCIWNMLEEVLFSKVNPLVHRQVLLKTVQLTAESLTQFVNGVREIAGKCKYSTPDDVILDKFIGGISLTEVRKAILAAELIPIEKDVIVPKNDETRYIGRTIKNFTSPIPEVHLL